MSEKQSEASIDKALVERVKRSADAIEHSIDSVTLLPRHGSARRYARAVSASGEIRVVMVLPDAHDSAHEIGATAYNELKDSPFIQVQQLFESRGIRVPEVHAIDEANRTIWLEDLGARDLDRAQAEQTDAQVSLYEEAIELLLNIQRIELDECPASIKTSRFSVEHFEWELQHYVEWRLEKRLGVELDDERRARLREEFAQISQELHAIPVVCSHRDFQSHNLMVRDDGEMVAIDFQDALAAPAVYDLVALLRDSYVVLDAESVRALFEIWFMGASGSILGREISLSQAWRWFRLQTIQRKLKDTGRFEYFALHDGNDGFLQYLGDSVMYVAEALSEMDAYPVLTATLGEFEPLFGHSNGEASL